MQGIVNPRKVRGYTVGSQPVPLLPSHLLGRRLSSRIAWPLSTWTSGGSAAAPSCSGSPVSWRLSRALLPVPAPATACPAGLRLAPLTPGPPQGCRVSGQARGPRFCYSFCQPGRGGAPTLGPHCWARSTAHALSPAPTHSPTPASFPSASLAVPRPSAPTPDPYTCLIHPLFQHQVSSSSPVLFLPASSKIPECPASASSDNQCLGKASAGPVPSCALSRLLPWGGPCPHLPCAPGSLSWGAEKPELDRREGTRGRPGQLQTLCPALRPPVA